MSCCGHNPVPKRFKGKGKTLISTDMLYTTVHQTITGPRGNWPVKSVLLESGARPVSGWKVSLPVKGQSVDIPGRNPDEVFKNAKIILERNGEDFTELDLWLNLNIIWLYGTPEKHHKVRLSDLMLLARPGAVAADPMVKKYTPMQWGAVGWNWMGLYLAKRDYSFREFLFQVRVVLDMLNPDTNPTLGCVECFREFSRAVDLLSNNPQWSQMEARRWLFNAHNDVNRRKEKPVLTWEQAAAANYWT